MTITVTLTHVLTIGAILCGLIPLACTGIYWAVKKGVENAILKLEARIARHYVTKEECFQHRAECNEHRRDMLTAKAN